MRRFLVEERQEFGKVISSPAHPGSPCDYGYSGKGLGDTTVRSNHGATHGPSFNTVHAGNPHVGSDNPFMWTGRAGR